jgi:hypothetical protein
MLAASSDLLRKRKLLSVGSAGPPYNSTASKILELFGSAVLTVLTQEFGPRPTEWDGAEQ